MFGVRAEFHPTRLRWLLDVLVMTRALCERNTTFQKTRGMKISTAAAHRSSISISPNRWCARAIHLLLVASCVAQAAVAAESPSTIYDGAKKSTFVIETFDLRGIPLSLGTGFAVRSNYLASNCHVLRGASRATAKSIDSGQSFPIETIGATDLGTDLVLLRIGMPVKQLIVDTNFAWSVGDSVYALGNPRGLEGTFSAGIISATRDLGGVQYIQITAPISPGSSGGPILSGANKVIGVATSAVRDAQNLNFAVSAQHLVTLLNAEPQEDSFSRFAAKHGDFARKQYPSRIANGDEVLIRNFEWEREDSIGFAGPNFKPEFSFSVYNGLSRPVRNVFVVISFLDANSEPIDTKSIPISGTIPSQSARRVNASVDGSVYRLNKLKDPQYPLFEDEGTGKAEYVRKFTLDTNSIQVKWRGKYVEGYKPTYTINGQSSAKSEYQRLFAEAAARLRVLRVLSFEFAD
jgi:hypothetical protein